MIKQREVVEVRKVWGVRELKTNRVKVKSNMFDLKGLKEQWGLH